MMKYSSQCRFDCYIQATELVYLAFKIFGPWNFEASLTEKRLFCQDKIVLEQRVHQF